MGNQTKITETQILSFHWLRENLYSVPCRKRAFRINFNLLKFSLLGAHQAIIMGLFYFCGDCNRKYKTPHRMKEHAKRDHGKELAELPERREYSAHSRQKKRGVGTRKNKRRNIRRERVEEEEEIPPVSVPVVKEGIDSDTENQEDALSSEKKSNEEEKEEEKVCVLCCDATVDTVFSPCGHSKCCRACAEKAWASSLLCPFCRRHIIAIIKPFY